MGGEFALVHTETLDRDLDRLSLWLKDRLGARCLTTVPGLHMMHSKGAVDPTLVNATGMTRLRRHLADEYVTAAMQERAAVKLPPAP